MGRAFWSIMIVSVKSQSKSLFNHLGRSAFVRRVLRFNFSRLGRLIIL